MLTTNAPCRSNDNHTILRPDIDLIANRNVGFIKHLPGKTQPLAVSPFLNLCLYISVSING